MVAKSPLDTGVSAMCEAARMLLVGIGEDPDREGLQDTPRRVVRALLEMTAGYSEDPDVLLSVQFDEAVPDQIVMVRNVEFWSMCEHHMLPFHGAATVAYLPGLRVAGLSKLARVVDCYARRLQVQERLTNEIAQAVERCLQPLGVGVVVQARHLCMGCRGVRKPEADMVTSVMLGAFRESAAARAEFLALMRR